MRNVYLGRNRFGTVGNPAHSPREMKDMGTEENHTDWAEKTGMYAGVMECLWAGRIKNFYMGD